MPGSRARQTWHHVKIFIKAQVLTLAYKPIWVLDVTCTLNATINVPKGSIAKILHELLRYYMGLRTYPLLIVQS